MLDFELVVPAYNEAKNLPLLVERAVHTARGEGFEAQQFNLVVVENGSTDTSAAVLSELQKGPLGAWVRVVSVAHNRGYGFGLKAGLATTTAAFVAWSHADLQCDPGDAFRALRLLKGVQGKAVVKGKRHGRNWKDRFVSTFFALCAGLILGLWEGEINAQPKVFARDFGPLITGGPDTFGFDVYALYQAKRAGYKVYSVPVSFPDRQHGVSKWAATFVGRYKTILGMIFYMVRLARGEGRL